MIEKARSLSNVRVGWRFALALSLIGLAFAVNAQIAGDGNQPPQDSELLPLVRVAPTYPARAAARGLSGNVLVEYTVTATGSTQDVTVVESTSSLFNRAAIEAAKKFKFRPRVENGQPVAVNGVQYKLSFELNN